MAREQADQEFKSRTENIIEQARNGECSLKGAAEQILECAEAWLDKRIEKVAEVRESVPSLQSAEQILEIAKDWMEKRIAPARKLDAGK